MRVQGLRYVFPVYIAVILLDINEFITRFLGSEGVLTALIFAMSIFLIMIAKPVTGLDNRLNRSFLIAFFGFISLGALASILEGNLEDIMGNVRYYVPSVLIYFSTYRTLMGIRNESELYRIFSISAVLIGVNAVLILLSILFNIDFHAATGTSQVERAVGLYSNANKAGYVSIIGQSLALLLFFSNKVKRPIFYFGLYIVCLLAAISTFSKGTILISMLLVARMMYLNLVLRRKGQNRSIFKRYVRIFSFLLFFLAVGFEVGFVNIQSKFTGLQSRRISEVQLLLQGQIDKETTTHRSELARLALNEMQGTFYLGAGLGEFKKMEIGKGTHNVYLLILGEAGVLALILYLLFFVAWFRRSFGFLAFDAVRFTSGNILILFFFSGFAAHTLLANKPFIFTLALVIAALKWRQKKKLT
jgi:O-antigen ligase